MSHGSHNSQDTKDFGHQATVEVCCSVRALIRTLSVVYSETNEPPIPVQIKKGSNSFFERTKNLSKVGILREAALM